MRESLDKLAARLFGLVGRGRVQLTDTSNATVLRVQVDHERHQGLIDSIPHIQHFGFASYLPPQTDVVVLFTNGDLVNGTAIASNSQQHRPPALQEGDAALYDSRGQWVWLTPTGAIIKAPQTQVQGNFDVEGDARVKGGLSVGGGATGTFTTPTGQTVTVRDGIVTNITS